MPNTHPRIQAWAVSTTAARLIDWVLAASFVLALIAYAYLGLYTRYMADDFAALGPVLTHGLLGAQIAWYQTWTGRFSYTFFYSLLGLIGPATPRFMPGALLTLWFASTAWALHRIHSLSGSVSWSKVALFAGLLCFATLETAPNVYQSLYWQTAALTHFVPFIPLSLLVGLMHRPASEDQKSFLHRFRLFCVGSLAFLAGGFSDMYVLLQSCGLVVAVLAVTIFAGQDFKSRIKPFLIAAGVGSLIALIIVAAAPGNSVRMAFFPRRIEGWAILKHTLWYSGSFVAKLVLSHPITFLMLLVLPFLIVLRDLSHRHETSGNHGLSIQLLWLVIICCIGPGVYALSVMPPERARILLSLIFVCGTVSWSCVAGQYAVRELRTVSDKAKHILSLGATVALLAFTLCPLLSFFSILDLREKARSFATDWDKQDSQLKMAKQTGTSNITVRQIGDLQSRLEKGASDLHLRPDPEFWINRATATYYGLTSVRATALPQK